MGVVRFMNVLKMTRFNPVCSLEHKNPTELQLGVFKILVEAVCGTTAADGVQDYIPYIGKFSLLKNFRGCQ